MPEIEQNQTGYSKKSVWIIGLLIALAAAGLIWVIWPKNPSLEIFYPKNPEINNSSNNNGSNTAAGDNNTSQPNQNNNNNNTTDNGNSGNNGDTVPPLTQPDRTPITTTSPTDNPGGAINPDTGTNNNPPRPENPGGTTVDGDITITTTPPTADNPSGGIRP